jgi:hypothetical protein
MELDRIKSIQFYDIYIVNQRLVYLFCMVLNLEYRELFKWELNVYLILWKYFRRILLQYLLTIEAQFNHKPNIQQLKYLLIIGFINYIILVILINDFPAIVNATRIQLRSLFMS